jgi:hypothetical protein
MKRKMSDVRMSGMIQFAVDFPNWKASKELSFASAPDTGQLLQILLLSTEKADDVVATYLKKLGKLTEIDALIEEAAQGFSKGEMKVFTAVVKGTGVMGKAVKVISESNPKWQNKEQKEVQQFLKLYATRQLMRKIGLPLHPSAMGKDAASGNAGSANSIQFIANYDTWKCVKKFRVTPETDPRTVGEFFVSYHISLENKLEKQLGEMVGAEKLNALVASAPTAKTAAEIPALFSFLKGNEFAKKMEGIVPPAQKATLLPAVKSLVLRKVLHANGLAGDYRSVDIPGLKRLLKKKKGE